MRRRRQSSCYGRPLAACQTFDEVDIAVQEFVVWKSRRRLPTDLIEGQVFRFSFEPHYQEKDQMDRRPARVLILVARQFLADLGGNVQLFA